MSNDKKSDQQSNQKPPTQSPYAPNKTTETTSRRECFDKAPLLDKKNK